MGKDFKSRIGSKRLNTLIPDVDDKPQISDVAVKTPKSATPNSIQQETKKEPTPPPPHSISVVSTFRINAEKLKTVKAIAFWDRKKIQEVFDEALGQYIEAMPKATVKKAIEEYTKRTE